MKPAYADHRPMLRIARQSWEREGVALLNAAQQAGHRLLVVDAQGNEWSPAADTSWIEGGQGGEPTTPRQTRGLRTVDPPADLPAPSETTRAMGTRMRFLRCLAQVSQYDIAAATGVTYQQIQKYEWGVNRVSASMLSRIAECLGVPMSEMFGEVERDRALEEAAETLGEAGALDLLRAYHALPAGADRDALVEFVRSCG